jgi:taurine--2-oxoglutarate transaminase
VFFTNGGADANEHAIRMARLHTGKHKVLSTYRSYHGGTHLAVNVTGDPRRWASDNGSSGTVHFFGPFLYRSAFSSTTEEEECQRALAHLEQVITLEGPETIAAIVLESIPGTAGIMIPPPGYLQGVRELCDRHSIVLIADEVMSGFGRAGKWFAIEHAGVTPDLLTFAKGVNSGYVPLGGVAISEAIYRTFADRAYPGGLTYSGHPLACAAVVATIETMQEEQVVEQAAALGSDVFAPGLRDLADRHDWIGEVRGTGAFWALELVSNRETREPLAPYGGSSPAMAAIHAACTRRGLLPFANFNRIHVVPPLTTSAEEAREGLDILDQALTEARATITDA